MPAALEQVTRVSVRLPVQAELEEMVTAELGRIRYQRRDDDSPVGVPQRLPASPDHQDHPGPGRGAETEAAAPAR